jgi:molecular chaperone DnaJ
MNEGYYDKNGAIIDFYLIFNLANSASQEEIKSAFRNLIKRYHPDTSASRYSHDTEKIGLIIRGYRILSDESSRLSYDRALFSHTGSKHGRSSIVPAKRIKYSASLANMLETSFLPKNLKHNDIIQNFGQDVEILLTKSEALNGALAYVELPARMHCPLCMGDNSSCHICRGIGRIHTTSQLEVKIPPHVDDSAYIDVSLISMRPNKLTSFRQKNLRIKISIV